MSHTEPSGFTNDLEHAPFEQAVQRTRQPRTKTKIGGRVSPTAYAVFDRAYRLIARREAQEKGVGFEEAYQKVNQSEVLEVILLAASAVVPAEGQESEADTGADPDRLGLGDGSR